MAFFSQTREGPQSDSPGVDESVLVSNSRLIAQFWTISVKFLGLGVGTLGEQVLPTKAVHLGASSA